MKDMGEAKVILGVKIIRMGDCKTPTLLNVIMVVVELIRGPMIEARVD